MSELLLLGGVGGTPRREPGSAEHTAPDFGAAVPTPATRRRSSSVRLGRVVPRPQPRHLLQGEETCP